MKLAEVILWSVGVLALALYFSARAAGDLEARAAVERFDAAHAAAQAAAPMPMPAVADHDDWAEYRVRLYERDRTAGPAPGAVLRIARIGLEVPVFGELTERNLNRGAARIAGTAAPGAAGNAGIAGHRDSFFRALRHVELGDTIEIAHAGGSRTYRVTDLKVVEPHETSVLAPTDGAAVTLVTCYPFWFAGHAPQRYIVRADADT